MPVLLLHGSDDTSVPVGQSAAMADALRARGMPVERHVYEGEGHGWRRAATIADDFDRVDAFLSRVGAPPLSPAPPRPPTDTRGRSAAPTARCSSRTVPAPTCNAAPLTVVADALADVECRRCGSTSRTAGRGQARARPSAGAPRGGARGRAELARRAKSPGATRARRPVDGWSHRVAGRRRRRRSVAGARARAVGYPLHPPGKPENLRVDHFPRLTMPVLFASGTRDAFGSPAEIKRHAKKIKGPVTFHWIETGDHGFRAAQVERAHRGRRALEGAAAAVVDFVTGL